MSELTLERGAPPATDEPGAAPSPAPATRGRAGRPGGREGDRRSASFEGRTVLLWLLRLPLVAPFVFMGPEFLSVALGRPGAVANVSNSAADVLGMSSLLFFLTMLTVTPLHTVTGWRWHRPLRRDYGIGMFVTATTDFICAATTTGDTFKGGLVSRIAGHTFLVAGTLSTFLLVPLALTASRRAQRWLGPHWKWLHRLVYVIWVTILLHLAFLFAFRTLFVDSLLVSFPLALLRIAPVRDRWVAARRARSRRIARWTGGFALLAVYGIGYVLLVRELVHAGLVAFGQHPSS
jgi:sulfoxide reductase heme-binding subunit YedZ